MNLRNHYMPSMAAPGYVRSHYVANDMQLAIDAKVDQGVTTNSLHSAIALGEQDPLLQCVATWLGEDINWQQQSRQAALKPIDITLASVANPEFRVGLAFKDSLDSLPAFPDELRAEVRMCTHKQLVNLCLSEVRLNGHDTKKLNASSCILLPETFSNSCAVRLINESSGASIANGVLDMSRHSIVYHNLLHSVEAPVTQILLQDTFEVDFQEWSGGTEIAIQSLTGRAVWVEQPDVQRYSAKLMRVGVGLGALLDEIQWT